MQNVVTNTCEKFHNDRLRNDRALVFRKYNNNMARTKQRRTYLP